MLVIRRGRRHPNVWRQLLARRPALPSARVVATVATVAITAVLILEWGFWYFAVLILLYVALDVVQRLEERRTAKVMMGILRTAGRSARAVEFRGLLRHCERAAWIGRELGWTVQPMVRLRPWKSAVRLLPGGSIVPLSGLLQALDRAELITRLGLPDRLPKLGRDAVQRDFHESGAGI